MSFNFPVGGDINLRGFSDTRGALISNYWGLFTHAMSHYSSKLHTCVRAAYKDGRTGEKGPRFLSLRPHSRSWRINLEKVADRRCDVRQGKGRKEQTRRTNPGRPFKMKIGWTWVDVEVDAAGTEFSIEKVADGIIMIPKSVFITPLKR
ncbi:hypothetical protein Trydic_g9629 [Trypoxylus dichotomus]